MQMYLRIVRIRSLYVHTGYYADSFKYETGNYTPHRSHQQIGWRLGCKV